MSKTIEDVSIQIENISATPARRTVGYLGDVAMETACSNSTCVTFGRDAAGNVLIGDGKQGDQSQGLTFDRDEIAVMLADAKEGRLDYLLED